MKVNTLPQLTWRWLNVNEIEIPPLNESNFSLKQSNDDGSWTSEQERYFSQRPAMSEEFRSEVVQKCNFSEIKRLCHCGEYRNDFVLNSENSNLNAFHRYSVREGVEADLFINLKSDGVQATQHADMIYIDVEKDAVLNLVILQQLNGDSRSDISLLSRIDDGGVLNVTHIELGAGNAHMYYGCDLVGFESQTNVHCAYVGQKEDDIDLSYHIRHIGEESQSDIQVNGALKDHAIKRFRGTIDFLEGSCGAKGNEEDFSILLDNSVKSISVPLLLCHEDDVEGNHAASAGSVDENLLFYLMTRGLSEAEAKSLIVESRMKPAVDQITDDEVRKAVREKIHERIVQG